MTPPLVWLPFDPAELGDPPARRSPTRWSTPRSRVPESVGDVEVYVTPYAVGPKVAEVIPRMTSLRYVQTLTAGVDNIRPAVPPGVTLCSGRGIHDTSTAELVLTLVLSSLRGVPAFVRAQDRHEWTARLAPGAGGQDRAAGGVRRDRGRRRGPAGAVRVLRGPGRAVGPRRGACDHRAGRHCCRTRTSWSLVLPLTDETRGLVDATFLASMKDGALLVNVARGPVVDTSALVAELTSGRLRAAVDVVDPEPLPADHPLWDCPGLLVSPHVGGSSSAMWPRAYRLVRDQLHRIAAGEEPVNIMTGDY